MFSSPVIDARSFVAVLGRRERCTHAARHRSAMPTVTVGASRAGVVAAAMAGAARAAGIMAAVARCVMTPTVAWASERRCSGKTDERESNDDQFHSASPVCPIGWVPIRLAHRSIVSGPCRDAICFISDASAGEGSPAGRATATPTATGALASRTAPADLWMARRGVRD